MAEALEKSTVYVLCVFYVSVVCSVFEDFNIVSDNNIPLWLSNF